MTKNTEDPNQERNGNERGAEINLRAYLRRKALCLYTTNSFDYFLFLFLCYYRIYVWLLICLAILNVLSIM